MGKGTDSSEAQGGTAERREGAYVAEVCVQCIQCDVHYCMHIIVCTYLLCHTLI